MKTISNRTHEDIKAVFSAFMRAANITATQYIDARRRAGLILKKLDASIDKVEARKYPGSQKAAILQMLKEGERITPDDARWLCGCRRLSARIYELKKAGHDIRTEMVSNPEGNDYARYYLHHK